MEIDKSILNQMQSISPEDRKAIIKMIELRRTSPELMVSLAVFRDVFVYRDMMNATVLQLKAKIRGLEERINDLQK